MPPCHPCQVARPLWLDTRCYPPYACDMEVQFTPDQEAFIRQAVASGRYRTAEDAVRDAMTRWEEGERSRLMLLAAFDEAEADLQAGHFTTTPTKPCLLSPPSLSAKPVHCVISVDGLSSYQTCPP